MNRNETRIVGSRAFEVLTTSQPPQRVGWVAQGAPEVEYPEKWWAVHVLAEQCLHGPFDTAVEAIDRLLELETVTTGGTK